MTKMLFREALLLVLVVCLPFHLSFRQFVGQYASGTRNHVKSSRSMSTGFNLPDFSQEPVDPRRLQSNQKILNPDSGNEIKMSSDQKLVDPNFDDMKQMAYILANVTEHLDTKPELAITTVSQNMGWLYSRNVLQLTQMLLQEFPSFRQDEGMMRSYMFLMEFLETVATESASMQKVNENALRSILEAAIRVSEKGVDQAIQDNKEQLLKPEFLIYLDAEIETHEVNSPMESMLITIKLRLLDEIGQDMGVDVMILPKLAAEEDPVELRRKTAEHLRSYDMAGKELFLQALRLMRAEMVKRYTQVDPLLILNLKEVEKITEGLIKSESK